MQIEDSVIKQRLFQGQKWFPMSIICELIIHYISILLQLSNISIDIIYLVVEWWFMYGNHTPTLRRSAIKVLLQIVSFSTCERNWSTFALIHTKQRNRLAYPRLQQLVLCYYNMKLKIRDMEVENDKVVEKDYLNLLDITTKAGE